MKPWRPGLLASLILLLICPASLSGNSPPAWHRISGPSRGAEVRDEADPRDAQSCYTMGQLEIMGSSQENGAPTIGLLVTDPRGRRIGQDPISKTLWQELPQAQAFIDCDQDETGAPRDCRGWIQICGPVSGTYQIQVVASENSKYSLAASGRSAQRTIDKGFHSTDSHVDLRDVPIQKGSRDTLLLNYSREPGTNLGFVRATSVAIAGNP